MRTARYGTILAFIFLAFFEQFKAQNFAWFPIHPATHHNFSIDTAMAPIAAVVQIDSTATGKYYLNTIVTKCDTCVNNKLANDFYDSTYTLVNQPQFLQYSFVKTSSNGFYFSGPKKFVIYPFRNPGNIWLFDTLNNIQASIISKTSQIVLGIVDSVCLIKLSSNDSIILSKNNGIIQFPVKTLATHRFKLAGIEGLLVNAGLRLKRFHDFFDFNVGDAFRFEFSDADYNILPPMFKQGSERWDILSAGIYNDSACYRIRKTYCDSVKYGNSQPSVTAFTQTVNITFIDSSSHPANLLPSEKISVNSYFIYNNGIPYIHKIDVGIENSRNTKSFGENCPNYYLGSGMNGAAEQTQFQNVYLNRNSSKIVGRKLTEGLGFTSELFNDYDRIYQRCMTGYIKGNDTNGVILSVAGLNDNKDFAIYPNPANKKFIVKATFDDNALLVILNSLGQTLYKYSFADFRTEKEIDVSQLTDGIYFISISDSSGIFLRKLVITN